MAGRRLEAGPARASGNGAVLDAVLDGDTWVVRFLSEPRTAPERLWFHLECRGAGGRPVRFEWVAADGCLGLGDPAEARHVRPVLRVDGGPWRRTGRVRVRKHALGGHDIVFSTPGPCRTVAAAFCYPYGPAELDATLAECASTWRATAWRDDVIGLTGEGRPLRRLFAGVLRPKRARPAAYVVARQHSGETPGSWVLDGLLRAVAGGGGRTDGEDRALLRRVDWWTAPLVDLDGVVRGDYGKDPLPIDLNRAWAPMPMRPEVAAIQGDMRRFAARTDRRVVLDLHAPGGAERRIYQFLCRDGRPRAQRRAGRSFTPFLADEFPAIPPDELVIVPRYPSRWDTEHTVAAWAWDGLNKTAGISLEITYQALGDGPHLEPDGYREIGRRVARATARWLLR